MLAKELIENNSISLIALLASNNSRIEQNTIQHVNTHVWCLIQQTIQQLVDTPLASVDSFAVSEDDEKVLLSGVLSGLSSLLSVALASVANIQTILQDNSHQHKNSKLLKSFKQLFKRRQPKLHSNEERESPTNSSPIQIPELPIQIPTTELPTTELPTTELPNIDDEGYSIPPPNIHQYSTSTSANKFQVQIKPHPITQDSDLLNSVNALKLIPVSSRKSLNIPQNQTTNIDFFALLDNNQSQTNSPTPPTIHISITEIVNVLFRQGTVEKIAIFGEVSISAPIQPLQPPCKIQIIEKDVLSAIIPNMDICSPLDPLFPKNVTVNLNSKLLENTPLFKYQVNVNDCVNQYIPIWSIAKWQKDHNSLLLCIAYRYNDDMVTPIELENVIFEVDISETNDLNPQMSPIGEFDEKKKVLRWEIGNLSTSRTRSSFRSEDGSEMKKLFCKFSGIFNPGSVSVYFQSSSTLSDTDVCVNEGKSIGNKEKKLISGKFILI